MYHGIAHVKKKWGRLKLDSGKASGGHYQAQFSQLRHCRRSKCANLVEWFNNHLHSPYPGSQELERLAASNGLTRNQVVLLHCHMPANSECSDRQLYSLAGAWLLP